MRTAEHAHFIGVGGYGMSAIARVMLEMGYRVTGSDVAKKALTDQLASRGATIYIGHQAANVDGADLVIYSSGIPEDNVERRAAKEQNIPLLHRSQMLARLLNERIGIAVTGAHGKTTTSSMIAQVMVECQIDPTYIIGGEVIGLGGNAKAGTGDYVVAEADESDGSFLEYSPHIAVVTNIEADHLENYGGSFENLKQAYKQFLRQIKPGGLAVLCVDDSYVRELLPSVRTNVLTYGIERDADLQAAGIRSSERGTAFTVLERGKELGEVALSVLGRHNVYNALATIAVCRHALIPFADIQRALPLYAGTKRRFQIVGDVRGVMVVDDYAHHPTEIQASIAAAKHLQKRIIAVFQPQRYSRTFFLLEEFSRAFGEADEVVITDIYSPAGEARIEGVSAERLAELIHKNGQTRVTFCATKRDVECFLLESVRPGDLVLTMGAGDIWQVAENLVRDLRHRT